MYINVRRVARLITVLLGLLAPENLSQAQGRASDDGPAAPLSQVLGRPTDHSITLSVLSSTDVEAYAECGPSSGHYTAKTPTAIAKAGTPQEFDLSALRPNTKYFYRLSTRPTGAPAFQHGEECSFHTQRAAGETFTFDLQGDSHPERVGKMFDAALYIQTMRNVAKDAPDFYLTMGDDFSLEHLITRNQLSQSSVDHLYSHQRGFLGLVGKSSPLFLVNGNHEEAAKFLLDGTAKNPAVYAGSARTRFFPLPAPGAFYTGNNEPVEHVGLPRDYYAWTWGDALFVVIDPYWHSSVQVDGELGGHKPNKDDPNAEPKGGKRGRDMWGITLGDTQHLWLEKTLRESNARFKFVFCHHVLGTGRGGIEMAAKFEWGGQDNRGMDRFFQNRPTWDKPIHSLLKETGVTIFFQGHDHLYAHQELDGVTYQSVPNPADPTFTAFNREAYKSGDILPNSGHLRVTVSHDEARVEYVRSFRPGDESEGKTNGYIAHSYSVAPRPQATPSPKPAPKSGDQK